MILRLGAVRTVSEDVVKGTQNARRCLRDDSADGNGDAVIDWLCWNWLDGGGREWC